MQDAPNIVILTGAGISAESGLATFRGPDGLWEGHRVENVCTPEALARDPATVHHFYDARRAALASVAPNAANDALARLDAEWPGDLLDSRTIETGHGMLDQTLSEILRMRPAATEVYGADAERPRLMDQIGREQV